MYTHRYVRTRLVEQNTVDRYDLIQNTSSADRSSNDNNKIHHCYPPSTVDFHESKEYWTNGRTTLLSTSQSGPPCRSSSSQWNQLKPQQQSVSDPVRSQEGPSIIMTSPVSSTATVNTNKASNSLSSTTNNHVVRNSLLAGSVAGMTSTTVCHPFDVLRVKMQSSAPLVTATGTVSTVMASTAVQPMGIVGTLRHTLQVGGARAMYTGLALPLAAQAVYKSTIFTINKVTETSIVEWNTQERYKLGNFEPYQLTTTDRFVSGCMGGAVNAALFCTPVEYVRNQQIAQIGNEQPVRSKGGNRLLHRNSLGPIAVIRNTIHSYGVSGLWRGLGSTVLRDSIGCGCFFVAMAQTQAFLKRHPLPWEDPMQHNDSSYPQPLSTSSIVVSGAAAGLAFWLWALPLDTCKTWIQSGTASNLSHAFQLSQRHGFLQSIPSLFRGWQVAYSRGIPSAAVTVVTYSLIFQHLEEQDS
ncbi:mitochondrial carrier protein [Nitzschia inconspicua]|uniref:Mitochondrial carrier protein n=1 Tax=Nitzschia inconspicua TaxID=303405 RepID=A0A9K3LGP9_9STRA|nr:mitochondrial carrier protein [Nitzschia inconspicua]